VINAADSLYREAALLAWSFHWSLDAILDMEHPLRRRFVALAAELNRGG
jgi:hypothetical protein